MGDNYKVIFRNNSVNFGTVCLYQTEPTLNINVMSLAWITQPVHPTTIAELSWNLDYSFVWSETGQLKPGVIFKASQSWNADLKDNNKVTLIHKYGAFTFTDQTRGSAGELQIVGDYSIPLFQASVGIGMAGSGILASQAQPNINYFFRMHPKYWITFGTYEQGEVLDTSKITNSARIDFPVNVNIVIATLNQDNTWTIEYE